MEETAKIMSLLMAVFLILSTISIGVVISQTVETDEIAVVTVEGIDDVGKIKNSGMNIIDRYGDYALIRGSAEGIKNLDSKGLKVNTLPGRTELSVKGHSFDMNEGPSIKSDLKIDGYASGMKGMYIVHMLGPVNPEWREELESMGVEIVNYVPNYAYNIRMTPEMKKDVKDLDFVDWVDQYHPGYKIGKDIDTGEVRIQFIDHVGKDTIEGIGEYIQIHEISDTNQGTILIGHLSDRTSLESIASFPDVYYISQTEEPKLMSEVGSQIIGGGCWVMDDDNDPTTPYRASGTYGAYVNQLGYDGTGVVTAIADTGLGDGTSGDAGHVDFTNRVLSGYDFGGSTPFDGHGHGTHCAGLMAGDTVDGSGVTYAGHGPYYVAQGLASDSDIYPVRIFDGSGSWVGPSDYYQILEVAAQNSDAYVHSNSWGSSTGGAYSDHDEAYDTAARDADSTTGGNQPMVLVIAASNDGSGTNTIGSPGNGKNVITVGASETYMPDAGTYGNSYDSANNPDNIADFSSRGWTDDNRVKPDVVAPGESTLSTSTPETTSSNLYGLYSEDSTYEWCSGTSQACPTAAGASAVVVDYYESTYGTRPSPAMVKAAMINTAHDLDDANGNTASIPNKDEGWGLVNLPAFIDAPASFKLEDQTSLLTTGVTDSYEIQYDSDTEPLKISVGWTDKEATSGDDPTLKNDLNLEVISPSGDTYYGNAFSGGFTPANTGANADFDSDGDNYDDVNNVENVYIDSANLESGTYTVNVIGYDVPADANGDGSANQDYALVMYNAATVTSDGMITLDRDTYTLEDTASITLNDLDLAGSGTHDVTIESNTEKTGETVTLTETATDGVFEGSIDLSATDSSGVLQVSDGDTVTVTYEDADTGDGSSATKTDTATVDGAVASPSDLTVEWSGIQNQTFVNENFDGSFPPTDWTSEGTDGSTQWEQSSTSSAGGASPEAQLHYGDSGAESQWRLYTGPYDTSGMSSLDLQWDNYLDGYGTGCQIQVETSSDGTTWHDTSWVHETDTDVGPGLETLTVSTSDVGSSTFYLSYTVDGDSFQLNDWYVDNVLLEGTSSGGTTEDNLLNWTLSPDDGAGDNDVTQYNIYRTDTSSGPWDETNYLTSVSAGTDSYRDLDKGEFDGVTWWYVVRAEDEAGNEDTNTDAVPEPGATGNSAPDAPTNPSPTDGATGVSNDPTLSVDVSDPDGDAMDVTFYDASDDSVIGSNTGVSNGTTSVTWSGLSYGTTYSWYVTSSDGSLSTTSSTWSFSTVTLDPPSITLTRPTGGEVWNAGTDEEITWSTTAGDGTINGVDLEYSSDGGTSWNTIVSGTADDGSYIWTVPDDDSTTCQVRATVNDDNSLSGTDTSGDFEIVGIPPGAPSGLTVERWSAAGGEEELVDNGIFQDNSDPWTLTEVTAGGLAEWDGTETYPADGTGSIYVQASATDAGNSATEEAYWEQAIGPTTSDITISGAFMKDIVEESQGNADAVVNTATVRLEVNDDGAWSTVYEDVNIAATAWTEFNTVYTPTGEVTDIRAYMHTQATGENGPGNSPLTATGNLWMDNISATIQTGGGGGTEDNYVNWTASADDGAGDNDVDYYNIYRADTDAGLDTASVYTTVAADSSADYVYIDEGAGTADTTDWWYRISAVDIDGLESTFTADVPEVQQSTYDLFDISLTSGGDANGWNFVSFNLDANGDNYAQPNDLVEILEDTEYGVAGNYDKVMYYDAASDDWRSYVPGRADHYNDITTWDNTMGVWIQMNAGDTLTVEGTAPTSTEIQLEAGWNMVSYPSDTAMASDGLPAEVTNIGYFNAGAEYNIAYTAPDAAFDLNPGEAYWLYCSAATTWTVNY